VPQGPFGHLLVVHKRATARPAVPEQKPAIFELNNFGVLARNIGAERTEVAFALAADAENGFIDDDNAAAERVVDLKPGCLIGSRTADYMRTA